MASEPDLDNLVAQGFNAPPPAESHNSTPTPEPTPDPVAPEAQPHNPTEDDGVDASVILMREDYSRKVRELGAQRRQLEAEQERLRDVRAFADRLETDADFRARIERAVAEPDAQAMSPVGPDPYAARIARLEQTIAEQRREAHLDAVDQAAQRVTAEFKLSKKESEEVVQRAVRAGTLHPGVRNDALYDVLAMSAALQVLPRAAANGQRELLDQMKDRGRQATPVAERAAPAEPEPDVTKMSQRDYENYLISNANKVTARR